MSSFDLQGRIALITGATGDIGQAISKVFSELGAVVAISGTKVSTLKALSEKLGGKKVGIFPADLKDRSAASELVKNVEKELGGIDILVSNAGITRDSLCLRMKDADWDDVLEVNLTAFFCLARSCLRGMLKRRFGRIIGITSVVAVTGNVGQSNYVAAKAGMLGISKALAMEVAGRQVTVNCVAPGFIETNMTHELSEAHKAEILSKIPVGRMGLPSDVAAAVAYLSSESASYITGQTLHVNGGLAMV